ncbi:TPA: hypothetical protein JI101_12685 [Acinetobacter baumannii]|nr:hypothetical protein FJU45_07445 [Acinetobacter baumannii]HAV5001458.1 hypothetical protein [Acinetobacter baumannii]HAV5031075.1 hypothetical protein [Acinetobacter baumannii]HAV5547682.1 hypothetical protein [Acinetobacter baumannii]
MVGEIVVSENTKGEKVAVLKTNKINCNLFISMEAQMKVSKSLYYNTKFKIGLKNNIFKIYIFLIFKVV